MGITRRLPPPAGSKIANEDDDEGRERLEIALKGRLGHNGVASRWRHQKIRGVQKHRLTDGLNCDAESLVGH
jgi:hypothetical protein